MNVRYGLILLVIFFAIYSNSFSQPHIEWQKCYGGSSEDGPTSIQQTIDSGYIITGYTFSNDSDVTGNHGGFDYWVVKLNSIGSIQWQKCLGGSLEDISSSIQQTNDLGYIIAGYSYSKDGDVRDHHGDSIHSDYWIIKLDSTGQIQWQKSYGGTSNDVASSIQQTTDLGYIIAGYSLSNDGDVSSHHGTLDSADCWIVKLDINGNIQWQKSLGGSRDDRATSIQCTSDGGFIPNR